MADKYTPEMATSGKERLRTWWKKVENNFTKIFGAVNKHIDGTADRHTADMIDYSDTETVKAKLDSTDTKLDTKVDKVSGKSLIDSDVADNLKYDTDKEEILIKVREPSQGLRVKSTAFSESTKIESGSITIESDAAGLGNYLSLSPFGGIMINTPTTSNADIRLVTPKGTHKISEKANSSDVFLKSGDVVLAKGKIIKVTEGDSAENVKIDGGGISISSKDVEPWRTRLAKNQLYLIDGDGVSGATDSINIKPDDIILTLGRNGKSATHKLSEKMSVSDLESYLLNGSKKSIIGDLYVNGGESSTNDITLWRVENNEPVTHKLSEKANSADIGTLSDLTTTDKSSVVAAINEVKSSGGGDVLDNLTYDSTNDIINSDANLLLTNTNSVAAYNGTFRGDIKVGQLGTNKWAYTISPITGFSTSVDVTCTSGNTVHSLSAKADTTNVLTRNNTQTFTPTGDYQPATKKYVDDLIAALRADLGLE